MNRAALLQKYQQLAQNNYNEYKKRLIQHWEEHNTKGTWQELISHNLANNHRLVDIFINSNQIQVIFKRSQSRKN